MGQPGLVVAIPAFNEAATVAKVISAVREVRPDASIVVVDDGSRDATVDVARSVGATVLTLPFNCGVGAAVGTAYRYAHRLGAQALVQIDADGQHEPEHIPELLAALETADLVVGARFTGAGTYNVHGPRRWSMSLLSRTVSTVVGARLTDVSSGFRAAGPPAIEVFARDYPAQYLGDTVESLVLASKAGLTVAQVPVAMRPRQGGRASHGTATSALHVGRAYLALFAAVTRPAPKAGAV